MKLYASPDFLRRHPNIQSVTDLKALPLLLVRAQLREGIKLNDGTVLRHGCQLHTDDPLVMVNAARMGLGILALSSDIIQKYLVSGELVEVLPELESERREFSAYYPAHPYQNPKTQAFLAHLRRARLNDSILPPR